MASTIWNQNLNAGEEWIASIVLATSAGIARNLSGCTFISQIRKHYKSISAKETVAVSIKSALEGQMELALTHVQTSNLKNGKYVYDIEMLNAPTLVVANATGTFVVGEIITGGTSSATGTIVAHPIGDLTSIIYIPVSGTFVAGEIITGDSENVYTATIGSTVVGKLERIIEGTIEIRPEVTR